MRRNVVMLYDGQSGMAKGRRARDCTDSMDVKHGLESDIHHYTLYSSSALQLEQRTTSPAQLRLLV